MYGLNLPTRQLIFILLNYCRFEYSLIVRFHNNRSYNSTQHKYHSIWRSLKLKLFNIKTYHRHMRIRTDTDVCLSVIRPRDSTLTSRQCRTKESGILLTKICSTEEPHMPTSYIEILGLPNLFLYFRYVGSTVPTQIFTSPKNKNIIYRYNWHTKCVIVYQVIKHLALSL